MAVLCLATATGSAAQEFTQVQSLTSRVLFAKEDQAALRRQAEKRRIEELDQRAQRQAVLLEQQAASVRQLSDQLQVIRDEKALIDLADAFDAAVLAGRTADARALLADDVVIRLLDDPASPELRQAADAVVSAQILAPAAGAVLPRSNQRVRLDGDHGSLIADGYQWGQGRGGKTALDRRSGRWEYGFVRSTAGWRIDRVTFTRAMPA